MIKRLIELTGLAILVIGLVYLLNQVGPLGADTRTMLKYLGLGVLGVVALGIVSVTILGLTAIIMGISFAKGGGFWSRKHREQESGCAAETAGSALKGALGSISGAGSKSSRKVEIAVENYGCGSFSIKTMSGDLTIAGHDQPGARASVEILEKEEGDAEACFEDGEIKIKTKSGAKAVIGDATVFLPAKLSSLAVESVNGDIAVSGFITDAGSFFKGVNGDISVSSLKNAAEVTVKTVSGDLEIKESQFKSLLAQSISGDVTIADSVAESAVIKTVSGDIDYAGSDIKNPSVKTVSGSINK